MFRWNVHIYVTTETSTKDVSIFAQTFLAINLKLNIRETVIYFRFIYNHQV